MNKKDIKAILMSMRTSENDEIVNKLLGKIDMMDDMVLQDAVNQIGGTEEAVKRFLEKKVNERQNNNTQKHTPINEMFSYGISGNTIHLHLPVELKELRQMSLGKGYTGMIDTINLYMLDAIDRIKTLKEEGYYKFQGKDSIYMISPILFARELDFLESLDFEIKDYNMKELNDDEFVNENPEAMLATHIFGKDRNVGRAKIKLDTISSKEWQDKKQEVVKNFESKGITLNDNKNIEK